MKGTGQKATKGQAMCFLLLILRTTDTTPSCDRCLVFDYSSMMLDCLIQTGTLAGTLPAPKQQDTSSPLYILLLQRSALFFCKRCTTTLSLALVLLVLPSRPTTTILLKSGSLEKWMVIMVTHWVRLLS